VVSVLATDVIAIPPSGPETVHSVKVFNLVFLQFKINVKQCLSISIGKKKIYICGIDIA
jgi:hypothetical protein